MTEEFDLVVIGGGPAGYTGAIRAAQLGMKVACIDKKNLLGGTCLNEGCIPSKALLHASEKYIDAKEHFKHIGIDIDSIKLNLEKMLTYKDNVIKELGVGISQLFKKNKIKYFAGSGRIIRANEVEIALSATNSTGSNSVNVRTKNILIATGSQASSLANVQVDEKYIVSSTGALSLKSVPKKMIVIGGGYIGLELGSVWSRLGAEVTVIEYIDRIVPAMDLEIGRQLQQALSKQGIKFQLNTKVISALVNNKTVNVALQSTNSDGDNKQQVMNADIVLLSVGRKPYIENLGLAELGIKVDNNSGTIDVDEHFATNIKNIYAVGDVIRGPMLAHKAEEEAIAAAEIIAGQAGHVNYYTIPSVIYTAPEVASIGYTEEQLKQQGVQYNVGKFPFLANSRARAINHNNISGMVKILADAKSDKVLGAHIIGPDAGNLIAEIALGMEFHTSAEDIARTCHAHPTLNEAVREAALAVAKRSINY